MFGKYGWSMLFSLVLSVFAMGCDTTPPATGKAKLRVVHLSYDGPGVDVMVGESKPITNLKYKEGSVYAEVEAGKELAIKVFETGKTDKALIDTKQTLGKDKSYTIVAIGKAAEISAVVLEDDNAAPTAGKAKLRVFHGSPDAPSVDVKPGKPDAEKLFTVAYKASSGYKEIDPAQVAIVLTAAGKTEAAANFKPIKLDAGQVYTVFALGTFDGTDQVAFGLRAFVDNGSGQGKDNVDLEADGGANTDKAKVRVLHMSYDGPAVDVTVNDATPPAIKALAYGESSGYAEVPAGKPVLKVTETGKTTPVLINASPDLAKGKSYSIVAYKAAAQIAPIVLEDDRVPATGKVKIRVIHAADAPTVDIKVNSPVGTPLFAGVKAGEGTAYKQVDAGKVSIVITAAGVETAVVKYQEIALEAGKVYTAVARGTLDDKDAFNFGVRVFIDNDEGKASVDLQAEVSAQKPRVLVVHASPDAPGVDLFVDGTKVNTAALEYPKNTGYLELTAGKRKIEVKAAADNNIVPISAELDFEAGKNYSLFAINVLASIEALRLEDDLTAPAAGKAHIRFVHLSPDAPAVDVALKGGANLFTNSKFKDASPFTPVDAGTYDLEVKLNQGGTVVLPLNGIKVDAGKIYTVFAKGLVAGQGAKALGAEIIVHNP